MYPSIGVVTTSSTVGITSYFNQRIPFFVTSNFGIMFVMLIIVNTPNELIQIMLVSK